jgi:hypothetical protein
MALQRRRTIVVMEYRRGVFRVADLSSAIITYGLWAIGFSVYWVFIRFLKYRDSRGFRHIGPPSQLKPSRDRFQQPL